MTTLVANIPPIKVWVRKEYLYDLQKGHGEYTPGYWVTCKSLTGRALYFETYLTEYGALYDKLPISAFLFWDPDSPKKPVAPTPDLSLTDLQFWNGFDTGLTIIEKNLIYNMSFEVLTRSSGVMNGSYLFTIDNYHPHRNEVDLYFSEVPDEHKSHNIIVLENGQIGAYPNNRCRMVDPSLTPEDLKTPDFKVSTRYFDVEHAPKWGRLGDQDDYFWLTKTEKNAHQKKEKDLYAEVVSWLSDETENSPMDKDEVGCGVAGISCGRKKQAANKRLDGKTVQAPQGPKHDFEFDR